MNILLVDDDKDSRKSVKKFLTKIGHQVAECDNGQAALDWLKRYPHSLVISDIKMPVMTGIDLLRSIKTMPQAQQIEVVLYTGYGNMESAIQALRLGAYDYLLKPINVEELAIVTERVAERQALLRENKVLNEEFDDKLREATAETRKELESLKQVLSQQIGLSSLSFSSQAMRLIYDQAMKYHTDRSIPVLIQGETGVGKEIIAKLIHYGNINSVDPFIDINCAALTPNLFESELFGYEAGAFTGGLAKGQKGKLDVASGGTLFLDEIGELPVELQSKLLRVIQEKEFYRIGGLKKIKTDVRLICATNVDLEEQVKNGKFRKDLYYRLKVGHVMIPPLRERKEDVLPLAHSFLQEFSTTKKKRFQTISDGAARIMLDYSWPGNVRELRNVLEWVTFMFDEKEVAPSHLAGMLQKEGRNWRGMESSFNGSSCRSTSDSRQAREQLSSSQDAAAFPLPREGLVLNDFIDGIVLEALNMHNGNKTDTARYLGISRKSLYCRLESMKKNRKKS